uniref:GHMP_kinases_C domain-containing protein n=1 Tax=Steinernema glaseri TaxID=37863 RepID=A0A1I7ZQT6_9BILA
MNKGASSHYNERVVECRLAAQLMAKKRGVTDWRGVRTLRQLARHLQLDPHEMEEVIKQELKPTNDPYTRAELLELLEVTDDQLNEHSLNSNTTHLQSFYLTARATHVYSEAARVHSFQQACESGDLKEMGRLMTASHDSLRDLYECSCAELDEVVARCQKAGTVGARLTGAGWGGCAVALVDKAMKEEVEKKIDVLFWSDPSAGLEIKFFEH